MGVGLRGHSGNTDSSRNRLCRPLRYQRHSLPITRRPFFISFTCSGLLLIAFPLNHGGYLYARSPVPQFGDFIHYTLACAKIVDPHRLASISGVQGEYRSSFVEESIDVRNVQMKIKSWVQRL